MAENGQARRRMPDLRRAETIAVLSAVGFTAAVLGVAALSGIDGVLARISAISLPLVLGLLALSLLNYALRGVRWLIFSHHMGLGVPVGPNLIIYAAGFALTTTPGKIGEVLRLWLLERGYGAPYRRTLPLLMGDRIGDFVATALLCVAALGAFGAYFWPVLLGAAIAGGVWALCARPGALLGAVGSGYRATGRWPRLFATLRHALRHASSLFTGRVALAAIALALIGWFAECWAFFWLLTALDAPVTLGQAVFVFAFAMLAGGLTMLPGGLGGTEASMGALLLGLGVDLDTMIAATAIIRVTTLWFAVLVGFASLPAALNLARRRRLD